MNKKTTNGHVLVVDDEPIILEMLKCILESSNYKVSTANNGLEALYLMAEEGFDMVSMDVRMPVMDGLTAAKFLRKCEQGRHLSLTEHPELAQSLYSRRKGTRLPVVAVTANIDDREIVLQAGMDEYISKPFSLRSINDVLDRFCGKSMGDTLADRRKHPRHAIKNDSIIVCNGKIGQVVDISNGGLAIKYANHELISNEWDVMIINKIEKTSAPYLPLKLIRNGEIEVSSSSGNKTQTIGAMFNNPDESQKSYIKQFIYNLS